MLNSLSFCLSLKLLISASNLNEILAGYSNLGCRFLSFITLSISCHSLLACRVSVERSAVSLTGILLYVFVAFSLAAVNIFYLCLIFISLINMCLGMFLLGFILYETLWASCIWVALFSHVASAAAAKLLQSCPTLCNPIDSSPSGSSVPGIL